MSSAGQDEMHEYALQALDRIAKPITGKSLLPVLWPIIETWAKSGEWERRHAALLTIAQVAEGCVKMLMQDNALQALVSICCAAAEDSHPIVKWCSCQAIGQVCTGACTAGRALVAPFIDISDDSSACFAGRRFPHACSFAVAAVANVCIQFRIHGSKHRQRRVRSSMMT